MQRPIPQRLPQRQAPREGGGPFQLLEYAFYFATAGTYEHFPVHVSKNERMISRIVSA